jgi:hypothetical protein
VSENWRDQAFKFLIGVRPSDIFEYFQPGLYKKRNKKRKIEILDPHSPQISAKSSKGSRICDTCLSLPLNDGKTVVLFIEIQNELYQNIQFRMFQNFYRLLDRIINAIIIPLCIFTGKTTKNEPTNRFIIKNPKTKLHFDFDLCTVESLVEAELEADKKPFALALLTAKKMLEADGDPVKRGEFGVHLAKMLKAKGWPDEQTYQYHSFIKLLLKMEDEDIPEEQRGVFKMLSKSIQEIVKETYIELAKDEGRDEGRKEGREELDKILSKAVRKMLNLGNSISEIANNLDISENQVSKYL